MTFLREVPGKNSRTPVPSLRQAPSYAVTYAKAAATEESYGGQAGASGDLECSSEL
jgi:V8-like Glu-specific endopeptidase